MKNAFGVEVSKGLPSALRAAYQDRSWNRDNPPEGLDLVKDYKGRRIAAHRKGKEAALFNSTTGKGSSLSTGKAFRTISRRNLSAIQSLSKVPRKLP